MADLVIQNPSITTNVFEYDDAGRVSAISGHPLAGEGGGEIVKSDLMWKPTVGADGYVRWTLASSATEPDAAYISGAQGPQGPSGTNGTNGTNGADGISPTFTITPTAGGTHVVLSGAQGEEDFDVLSGAKGADGTAGFSPTVSTTTTATEDRTGTVLTFTYGDEGGQTVSYTAWNGKDGTGATVDLLEGTGIQITHTGTTYTIGVSADYLQSVSVAANGSLAGSGTSNSPLSLKTSAEQALAAVDGKVSKPSPKQQQFSYAVWDRGPAQSWADFGAAATNWANNFLFDSESPIVNGINGLSAGLVPGEFFDVYEVGIDTTNMTANKQYAFTTTGWEEVVVPSTSGYLPLSGGIVSGSTYFSAANGKNVVAVASAASLIGASRQTSANFGQNDTAMGTTWMGVGGPGMYRGFLKYTQGGNVGALDSDNTMQVEFTPNNKGTIFARAKNNGTDSPETQILNPTKASCDAMAQSANANLVSGPNYMLAKNADGQFVIGAACINCTAINDVTLAPNTYYFVYEV